MCLTIYTYILKNKRNHFIQILLDTNIDTSRRKLLIKIRVKPNGNVLFIIFQVKFNLLFNM